MFFNRFGTPATLQGGFALALSGSQPAAAILAARMAAMCVVRKLDEEIPFTRPGGFERTVFLFFLWISVWKCLFGFFFFGGGGGGDFWVCRTKVFSKFCSRFSSRFLFGVLIWDVFLDAFWGDSDVLWFFFL